MMVLAKRLYGVGWKPLELPRLLYMHNRVLVVVPIKLVQLVNFFSETLYSISIQH
jgi:hypothetical protein